MPGNDQPLHNGITAASPNDTQAWPQQVEPQAEATGPNPEGSPAPVLSEPGDRLDEQVTEVPGTAQASDSANKKSAKAADTEIAAESKEPDQGPPRAPVSNEPQVVELATYAVRIKGHLRKIETAKQAVNRALDTGVSHILLAGRELLKVKAKLDHGDFLPWLDSNGIQRRTAQRHMKDTEAFDRLVGANATLAHLPFRDKWQLFRKRSKDEKLAKQTANTARGETLPIVETVDGETPNVTDSNGVASQTVVGPTVQQHRMAQNSSAPKGDAAANGDAQAPVPDAPLNVAVSTAPVPEALVKEQEPAAPIPRPKPSYTTQGLSDLLRTAKDCVLPVKHARFKRVVDKLAPKERETFGAEIVALRDILNELLNSLHDVPPVSPSGHPAPSANSAPA